MIKIFNTLFKIDFWQIFLSEINLNQFFLSKGELLKKNNYKINNEKNSFYADPFIVKKKNKQISLLVEDFSFFSGAKISLIKIAKNKKLKTKILEGKHYSYPFTYNRHGQMLVYPEMSEENRNIIYNLNNKKKITNYLLGYKIIDPTIIKIKGIYWLFCGLREKNNSENKNLYLFYSKNLIDGWTSHKKNPVLKNNNKARSAGNILKYKNNLYRPSQFNLVNTYGAKLIINKIIKITKNEYKEREVFTIKPSKDYDGMHHISYSNNCFAFDQKRIIYSIFKPLYYIIKFVKFYHKM